MAKQVITLNARGSGILDGRQVRAMAFAPARDQLLHRIFSAGDSSTMRPSRALVIGGGYSPIAGALRDRGFETTAVDPSAAATAIARSGAPEERFSTAPATDLGVEEESFDFVYCADTLEVGDDLDGMIGAAAATARPGATLIFDTVTDTPIAKLIYLLAFQRLPFTRIMPPGRYAASRLRNPRDLERACRRAGVSINAIVGFEPKSVGSLVRAVLDRRSDQISDEDLPAAAGFRLSPEGHAPVVTYFAVTTKET